MATVAPTRVRPRREREEEVLVWPDLVFVEFIAAVLFTATFTLLSVIVNAPLINRANPDETPNPSKAPWYFLNLQELLLHMHPALAGVIVPTVWLILLAAIPYLDRNKEGQGVWFGTVNSVRITIWSTIVGTVGTIILILLDSSKHVKVYEQITGSKWPVGVDRPGWVPDWAIIPAAWDLVFSRNFRAIQTEWKWSTDLGGLVPALQGEGHDGRLDWPNDFTQIPIPGNLTSWPYHASQHGDPPADWWLDIPGWLSGLYWYDLNLNLPAFIVELLIPTLFMTGLPILLIYALWRIGWISTMRDVFISLFSGFLAVYWIMTIVGAAFRGAGQDLVWPWQVPTID